MYILQTPLFSLFYFFVNENMKLIVSSLLHLLMVIILVETLNAPVDNATDIGFERLPSLSCWGCVGE